MEHPPAAPVVVAKDAVEGTGSVAASSAGLTSNGASTLPDENGLEHRQHQQPEKEQQLLAQAQEQKPPQDEQQQERQQEQQQAQLQPTRLQSWQQVLDLLRGFEEAHLLVGFGDVAQYQDVGGAVAALEPLLAEVQRRTDGRWLLLYGGDPATPAKPNVGLLVQLLARRWRCPVLAPLIDTRIPAAGSPLLPPLQPGDNQEHLTYIYVLPAQYAGDVDRQDAAAATAATVPAASGSSGSSILGKRRAEVEPEAGDREYAGGTDAEAATGRQAAADAAASAPTTKAAEPPPTSATPAAAAPTPAERGAVLWGGLRHGRPVGASAFYLHDDLLLRTAPTTTPPADDYGQQQRSRGGGGSEHGGEGGNGGSAPVRRLLTAVIAAGGGDIAVRELEYLHQHKVPWTYVPCAARCPPAHYASPFGPVHDWAAATRGDRDAQLPLPPPLRAAEQPPGVDAQVEVAAGHGDRAAEVPAANGVANDEV
ncbi:hypothetical protein HYH02_005908 [Chlamydomonas schloesseri]|uniref:Uncharacterized protein n=1 Tax=Chlamydomonas schloesseri TaxID=2026947 RepID=A0A835WLD4_9CHLO|nr:hypothetical protein HYH02_005908 [Chlamydomonas schloesseri]|eukprot:KAG2449161.1 hypothetical protein HYH02_005908 [Chlamydomonas schloesseri]